MCDAAKAIREDLKKAGYKRSDISVRTSSSMYDTAIHITIKNPHIDRRKIEKIVTKYEKYERDLVTGEILQGGNTLLFVDYEYDVFKEVSQEWAATAKGLMNSSEEVVEIFNGLYLLNTDCSSRLQIRQQNSQGQCTYIVYDFEHLCQFLYKFSEFGTIAL